LTFSIIAILSGPSSSHNQQYPQLHTPILNY